MNLTAKEVMVRTVKVEVNPKEVLVGLKEMCGLAGCEYHEGDEYYSMVNSGYHGSGLWEKKYYRPTEGMEKVAEAVFALQDAMLEAKIICPSDIFCS